MLHLSISNIAKLQVMQLHNENLIYIFALLCIPIVYIRTYVIMYIYECTPVYNIHVYIYIYIYIYIYVTFLHLTSKAQTVVHN